MQIKNQRAPDLEVEAKTYNELETMLIWPQTRV